MGKTGKQQKRQRRLVEEANADTYDAESIEISDNDLALTVRVLNSLVDSKVSIVGGRFKQLRTALYQLQNKKNSLSQLISDALRDGRYEDAIFDLQVMRTKKVIPKLGAIQRWTRDCDAASRDSMNPIVLQTLDAILRTADPDMVSLANRDQSKRSPIIMFPQWAPPEPKVRLIVSKDAKFLPQFKIIYEEKGADRKPPNAHDMILYNSKEGTIELEEPFGIERVDIPTLPGVFVIKNVLTPGECISMISAAETLGFTPDHPTGGTAKESQSVLAHNFFWLADPSLLDAIYQRCLPFLPPTMDGAIAGLNSRWRMYRYTPGSIYRPHIDGAWPGSGQDSKGKYIYDAFGDRWSKLTFLIRLNDDFEGGETTFFIPTLDVGYLAATPVSPRMGSVLVFPHGDACGSLLHEGSPVLPSNSLFNDTKYVIRTEVLYKIPGHDQIKIN